MQHFEKHLNKFRFYREWTEDRRTSKLNWAMLIAFSILALVAMQMQIHAMLAQVIEGESQTARISAARPAERKIEVLSATPQESDRIIVRYKERDLPRGLEIAAERANLEKAQGLTQLLTIDGIGAVVYQVSDDDTAREVVDRLNAGKRDIIEYAEIDMLVPPALTPNDPNLSSAWHLPKVEAISAWDTARGDGVVIGIADSGVDCTHPDLVGNCVPGWNVVGNNSDTSDINGHGTAVAGAAAQSGDNAAGSAGVAYNAKIMPLRITDSADGYAYWSAVAQAITYAADRGVRVVSNSYGSSFSSSVQSAAEYLRSKGGVFVAAAMNNGAELTDSNPSSVITVSATDSNDVKAGWSNYGAPIDVSAPGVSVYSTTRGGGYAGWSGTSFATPITAGTLALILSQNPALSASEAEQVLFSTAHDLGTAGWDTYYGHGRVNAAQAVALASSTKGTMGVPDTTAPSAPQNLSVTSVTGSAASLAWGQATDNVGVTGYAIYRNGTKLTTVAGTTYTNTGLTPETAYTYAVTALDKAGNESAKSAEVVATIAAVDFAISSYSVPAKTSTSATIATTLTRPGTVRIQYGVGSNNLTMMAEGTVAASTHEVSLTNLTAATTYYYQITAVDASGTTVTSPVSSFKTSKATGGGKPRR